MNILHVESSMRSCFVVLLISVVVSITDCVPIQCQTLLLSFQGGFGPCGATPYAADSYVSIAGLRVGWIPEERFQVVLGYHGGSGIFSEGSYKIENNLIQDSISIVSNRPTLEMVSILARIYSADIRDVSSFYFQVGLGSVWSTSEEIYINSPRNSQIVPKVNERFGFILGGGGVEWRLWNSGIVVGIEIVLGLGVPQSKLLSEPTTVGFGLVLFNVGYQFSL